MKKIFTCLWMFIGLCLHLTAQNIDWEARVNNVRSREGGIGGACWESGDEEYSSLFAVKDNIMGSFSTRACVQCNANGDCEYGGNTGIASSSNVNATNLQLWYQGWEDDGGNRCSMDSGDDCNCENNNLANITIRTGTVCIWNNYGDYGCGNHDRIRLGLRWRWSTAQFSTHPSSQIACDGTNATFSAALNSSYNGGITSYQWEYYNGSSWVNQGSSSVTYSNLVIAASTSINGRQYRLKVTQCNYDGGTRTTYSNSATLTVKTLSSVSGAGISGIDTRCGAGNSTFILSGGTVGTGAVWRWYVGNCSGTSVGSGTSLNYNLPIGNTTLYARLEGDCNTTSCVSKTITVNQLSSPMTNASYTPAAVCSGANVSVTATGGTLGTNAQWRWYSDIGLTSQIATGNPANVNPQAYPTVYVAAVDVTGICPVSSALSANLSGVVIHTASTNPTSTNYSSAPAFVCNGNPVSVTVTGGVLGNGASWKVYDRHPSDISAVLVLTTNSNNFNITPPVSGSYWVRGENLCNNTNAVEIKFIVNASTNSTGTLTGANSSSTCIVNDNLWHYFRNSDGELIAAINSKNQNLGLVTVATVLGDDGPFGTGGGVSGKCTGVGEYHVPRVVNISSQYASLGPVGVILYFTSDEYISHKQTTDLQNNFYKYCYGITNTAYDLTVSAMNSAGLPDSNVVLSKGLKSGSSEIYQFELDLYSIPANGTYTGGRVDINGVDLYIHNSGGLYSILPVELTSFTGSYKEMAVDLKWQTATELNNHFFVIERSLDGRNFESITQVNGAGTTSAPQSYQWTDNNVAPGTNYYYRLKQVDFDGELSYSAIINISVPSLVGFHAGQFYPNPAKDKVNLGVYSDKTVDDAIVRFVSMDGRIVMEKILRINEGYNNFDFSIEQLPSGVYRGIVISGNKEINIPLIKAE